MAKKKNDEEFSVDLSAVSGWFKRIGSSNNAKWLSLVLIIIAIFFSIYFRSYSYNLPITDEWAYSNVYNSVRSQVSDQINQQYPNLPIVNKNKLIDEEVNKFLQSQGANLEAQVNSLSLDLKSRFQDDSGQTYLLAIDPYVYYRQADNVLKNGHTGDLLVDGRPFNNHVGAPDGGFASATLHPYFEAYYHKFMSIFTNNSLMKNVFFVPILLSALSVIPAFFIAKRRVGYFGGFIAAMIVAVHSAFIGRTAGGFADTDAYNVLFPLLIAWLFIEAFESNNWKKQLGLLTGTGFLVGLYSFTWTGWWYIFDFLLIVVIVYLFYFLLKSIVQNKSLKKLWQGELRNSVIVLVSFILFSGLFVTLFTSFKVFLSFLSGPLAFEIIKQASHANLWPNVYTTVAELNPASIGSIIGQIGGKLFFFIASMGLILTLLKRNDIRKKDYLILGSAAIIYLLLLTKSFIAFSPIVYLLIFLLPLAIGFLLLLKDDRKIDIKYGLFLAIWFVGTIYASTKGTRFVLLLVPAYAIALGISLGTIQIVLTNLTAKEFKINKKIVSGILMVLLLLLLISPIKAADRIATGEIPSMNDAWWNTLTNIKENSAENAIITSWWDFGHWFKAVADRPVTFDGGSQNRPQAHWVGKLLMSEDEHESIAILRMLDCGGNNAFKEVNKKFQDTEISVNIIYEIIMKDKVDAESFLAEKGFSVEEINTILNFSHCEPPEAFLITSGDMVGKAGVWSHFGSWDFDRSFIYNNVKKSNYQDSIDLMMGRFGFTEDQASNYYYDVKSLTSDSEVNNWIAPWPNYATPALRGCVNDSETATCSVGVNIGQSNLGQTVSVSHVIINFTDISNTNFVLSFVDPATGLVAGQQLVKVKGLVMVDEDFKRYDVGGTDLYFDVVYDKKTNKALVTDPALSQSLFSKLFFWEGRGTSYFEKFSDVNSVTGSRIIVWKVNWNGSQ
ncbi:MAG: STT3 domain-containing protein [archaeon]